MQRAGEPAFFGKIPKNLKKQRPGPGALVEEIEESLGNQGAKSV